MADKKISELTELTDPSNADYIPIVDTANQETKKISYASLVAAAVFTPLDVTLADIMSNTDTVTGPAFAETLDGKTVKLPAGSVAPADNADWEQILVSTNGQFVANFELADATGLVLPNNVIGHAGGKLVIGNGVKVGGNQIESPHSNLTIQINATGDTVISLIEGEITSSDVIASVKHASIGNSVTTIGDYAFDFAPELTSVTIPNSVTTIGRSAFTLTQLTSVTIPNSVTSIGYLAFSDNYQLTSVTIPNSVTTIGASAFYNCRFTFVTIPNSVTSIGNDAFVNVTTLATVNAHITKTVFDTGVNILSGTNNPLTLNVPIGDATWDALIAASPTSYQGNANVTVVATL